MAKLIFSEENLVWLEQKKKDLEQPWVDQIIDRIISKNKSEKLTDNVRKKVESLIKEIEEVKLWIELIDQCLEEQRGNLRSFLETDKGKTLNRQKHFEDHTRKRSLRKKPSKKIYYIQEMFSLPSDYFELEDEDINPSKENKLLNYLIINPAFIKDEFLISIWVVIEKDFTKLNEIEKLKFKIGFIPKLKELFKDSISLKTSWDKKTSRILSVENWKILLFQTIHTRNGKNIGWYEKKIQVFHDIYSLFRSQIYTSRILKERQESIRMIWIKFMQLINSWLEKFKDQTEMKNELNSIRRKLWNSRSFYEQKIIKDRLEKINFDHKLNNKKSLEWAFNDTQNAFLTRLSQISNIEHQHVILQEIIDHEEKLWKIFESNFAFFIKTLDQEDLKRIISSNDDEIKEKYLIENKEKLREFSIILSQYDSMKINFCPYPFSRFHERILEIGKYVNSCMKNNNLKWVIDWIFFVNIYLKMQRFALFIFQSENRLKLYEIYDGNMIDSIYQELVNIENITKSKNFLEEKNAWEKFDDIFFNFFRQIDDMKVLLKEWKVSELLKYLEKMKEWWK